MKLFKKSADVPKQTTAEKIEALEIELGITPLVTEENYEREFDRMLIDAYREKYGNKYKTHHLHITRFRSRKAYDHKDYLEFEKIQEAFHETLGNLILEDSQDAFTKEFDREFDERYC